MITQAESQALLGGLLGGTVGTLGGLLGGTVHIVGGVVGGVVKTLGGVLLASCVPQPYDATVEVIGPAGGTRRVGPHKLSIPRGALPQRTVITAEAAISNLATVELHPHGLRFAKQPLLTLSYSHCRPPADFREGIGYLNEANEIIEWPELRDRVRDGKVTVALDHFSRYAVAY